MPIPLQDSATALSLHPTWLDVNMQNRQLVTMETRITLFPWHARRQTQLGLRSLAKIKVEATQRPNGGSGEQRVRHAERRGQMHRLTENDRMMEKSRRMGSRKESGLTVEASVHVCLCCDECLTGVLSEQSRDWSSLSFVISSSIWGRKASGQFLYMIAVLFMIQITCTVISVSLEAANVKVMFSPEIKAKWCPL